MTDGALCPCGCGKPPRPGKKFAGPHHACLTRWLHATGQLHARARRARPAARATKAKKATDRAQREAAAAGVGPLTGDEVALWRVARLLGYDNAGKNAVGRARVAVRGIVAPGSDDAALAAYRAAGRRGGSKDSTRKHGEALKAHAAAHGLTLTRRVVAVWAAAYKCGYVGRYGAAYDATVTRLVRKVGGNLTAVRRQLSEARP